MTKIKRIQKYALVCLLALCVTATFFITQPFNVNAATSDYQEVEVTGFNADIIANGATIISNDTLSSVTTSFDDPTLSSASNVFYEKGFTINGGAPISSGGLPVDRKVGLGDIQYTLQPYNANNVLLLTKSDSTKALTLVKSGVYDKIIVLASSASGNSSFSASLNFSDGTSTTTTFSVPDWWTVNSAIVVSHVNRMKYKTYGAITAGTIESTASGQPYLYNCEISIPLADQGKLLTTITFTKSDATSSRTGIFAVSGKRATGTPSVPTVNAATSISDDGFTANWSTATTATKYYLDVATDANFNSMVTGYNNKDVGNVTTHPITGLSAGTTYYYRVRAANTSGQSFSSSTITVTTTMASAAPSAPVASAATAITSSGFTANWSASATATKYYLDVATDTSFNSKVTGYDNKDVGTVTTLAITGLSANTTYYYRVRAANAGGTSGNSSTITAATIAVLPKTLTLNATVNNKPYDGTTAATLSGTPTLVGVTSGDTVTLSGTASATFADANVGTGKAVTITGLSLAGADKDKYQLDVSGITADILKKNPVAGDLTFDLTAKFYSGTAQGITAPTVKNPMTGMGAITVSYTGTSGTTYTKSTTAPTNAGTYSVSVSTAGGTNFNAITDLALGNYIINKAPLTITGGTVASKSYDNTTTAAVTAVTFSGLKNGETLALTTDYTVTNTVFNSAEAGSGKTVTGTVTLGSSAKASNYSLASGALSIMGQSIGKVTYPGTKTASASVPENTISTGVSVALPALPAGASYGTVSVTTDNGLVTGTPSVSGTTLTFNTGSKATGTTDSISVNVTGATNYNDYAVTVTITAYAKTAVTIAGVSVADKFYDGTAATKSGTPTANDGTGTVTIADYVYEWYNGTTLLSEAPKNVGSYKLVVSVADDNTEFTGKQEISFTISQREITITADAKSKTYGDTDPTLTYEITTGELVGADSLTGGISRVAGENVGSYNITSTLANSNYDITFVGTDKFTISQRAITITADAKSKAYGETDPTLTYAVTTGGLVGTDSLTGGISRAAGENVGSYNITSTLANSNYDITFVGTDKFTITNPVVNIDNGSGANKLPTNLQVVPNDIFDNWNGGALPTLTAPNGFVFGGWANASGSIVTDLTNNITLKPIWKIADFAVTLEQDGNTLTASTPKIDGISYNYKWFVKDGNSWKLIEDETGSTLKIDKSAEYKCEVEAKANGVVSKTSLDEMSANIDGGFMWFWWLWLLIGLVVGSAGMCILYKKVLYKKLKTKAE